MKIELFLKKILDAGFLILDARYSKKVLPKRTRSLSRHEKAQNARKTTKNDQKSAL